MSEKTRTIRGYTTKYDWGKSYVSVGSSGIVLESDSVRKTAFFESYPLSTFIRGEGLDILEAEENAWKIFKSYEKCAETGHDYIRTSVSGGAKCGKCGIKHYKHLENLNKCHKCGLVGAALKTYTLKDESDNFCLEHALEIYEKIKVNELYFYEQEKMSDHDLDMFKEMIFRKILELRYLMSENILSYENQFSPEMENQKKKLKLLPRYRNNAVIKAFGEHDLGLSIIDMIKINKNMIFNKNEAFLIIMKNFLQNQHLIPENNDQTIYPSKEDGIFIYNELIDDVLRVKKEREDFNLKK